MSTAVSMEPLGSTQQLHWVAKELAVLALWFGLAVIRHDNVCFVWFHAYVHTWFPNNKQRGGGEREWPSSLVNCHDYSGLWVSFKWYFIHISSEKSTHSCLRCLFFWRNIYYIFFSFFVHSQKPRTWNRRSVCRSWRAAQGLAAPQMTQRSERSARDPAHQASALSQV